MAGISLDGGGPGDGIFVAGDTGDPEQVEALAPTRRRRVGRHRRLGQQRRAPVREARRRDDATRTGTDCCARTSTATSTAAARRRRRMLEARRRPHRQRHVRRAHPRRAGARRVHRGEGRDRGADEDARARARTARDHGERGRAGRDRHAAERDARTRRRCAAPTRSGSPAAGSAAADEVADAIVFLASDAARYVTGPGARRRRRTDDQRRRSDMPVIEVLVDGLDHPEGVCWDPGGRRALGRRRGRTALPRRRRGADVGARSRARPGSCSASPSTAAGGWSSAARAPARSACSTTARCACCATASSFPNYPAFGAGRDALLLGLRATGARTTAACTGSAPDGELDVLTDRLPHFPNGCAVTAGRRLALDRGELRADASSRIDLASGEVEEVVAPRRHRARRRRVHRRRRRARLVLPARPDRPPRRATGRSRSSPRTRRERCSPRRRTSSSSARERDRLVSANLGRWHLTLLDVGLRGAPLHYPERWAADA